MTAASATERTRALSMLLLANFFWGLSFPLIKAIALLQAKLIPGSGGTWFSTAYALAPRFVLAALVLLAWRVRVATQTTVREWRQGLILGGFASAGMLFQIDGLQFTAASTSAFLTQFYAILIPLWVAFRTGRSPGKRVWTCCALVLAGVAILGRFDWVALHFGRGEWETLVASVFFMGQILALERKEFAGNRPECITFVMFLVQGVVFTALTLATAPDSAALRMPWTSGAWVSFTVVLTLASTVGAYLLMNAWQPKITATEAGLIYCIEPIFGSVMALFLPAVFSAWAAIEYANETATWTLLLGGGLITLANVLLQLRPPKR